MDVAIIEYQTPYDDDWRAVKTDVVGLLDSPALLTYRDPERPITRIRISMKGECGVDADDLDGYLARLHLLESPDAPNGGER